ncbi:MAG: ferredoxin reductase [Nevskia sp.]|nr:ferredoxin reductase [Nevskia sp.]
MSATALRTSFISQGLRRALSSRIAATLAYPHGVDRYVESFAPTYSLSEVRAEVTALRHQTDDSVTMTLRPNGNWQGFRAGQYLRLTVEINGVRRSRCYSPANSVHAADGLIELTVKAHAGGFVSKYLQQNLRVGTIVGLSQAEGAFALPEMRPSRVLLISGGSGITPVMAMLRTLCDEGRYGSYRGQITFLHYSNAAKDQIYAAELTEIAARYPNVQLLRGYVETNQGGELNGRFCRAHLNAVPDYAEAETFLCGPPGMMKAVQKLWADEGLAERLHLEHFAAAPAVIDTANAEGEVRFARSERLARNSGGTLLDQAEAAGLKPESGCRMGICHACTCRKTSGRVRDTRTGEISDAGEGDIQICISVPVGTVTLDI